MREHVIRTLQALGILTLAFGTAMVYFLAVLVACAKAGEKSKHR